VRGKRQDFLTSHPQSAALVVEVAVSGVALDRELISLYAEAGVEEYWIILAADRAVEIHRQLAGGAYREKAIVASGERLHCTSVPELTFPVDEIFA
jgi:Uma2 family endonuclease